VIRNIADLLTSFSNAEAKKLAEQNITHAPTIGAMYEGLTAEILGRSLPSSLNLQVTSGFVSHGGEALSGQIDCMLVRGSGEAVPYTKLHKWHVKDVLAVVEVKKALFGNGLSDAYQQLDSVLNSYSQWVQTEKSAEKVNLKPSLRVFSEVTGIVAPESPQWNSLPTDQHLILHTIISDQLAPVRIILGYGGYKTESGLREGLASYLENNMNRRGFGIPNLPNLIISGGNSLIKLSGHPYRSPREANGRWPIMASSHVNPNLFLLETIWTRLSYDYALTSLFGEDLEMEGLAPFLSATPTQAPGDSSNWGWFYHVDQSSEKTLATLPLNLSWEPVELTTAQYAIINELCEEGEVDISDPSFEDFASQHAASRDDFVFSLIETRLVARRGNILRLVTERCACVVLPDGRIMAADDNTGRLSRWTRRYIDARTTSNESGSKDVS
jgi:hypothetical protein